MALDPEEAQVITTLTHEMFVFLGLLITVLVPIWLNGRRARAAAEQAAEQVTNSHDTNLRDDISAVIERLESIESRQKTMRKAQIELQNAFEDHIDDAAPMIHWWRREAPNDQ